jgi:putative PIN family toxin of toxin-antitoxin system
MRIVADTNVVVSGLLWLGNPGHILEAAARGELHLSSSPSLIDKLTATLRSPKLAARVLASGITLTELLQRYLEVASLVEPERVARVVPDDPDDDQVIAAALAARADLIVSGDSHLLCLKEHGGIRIVTPAEAVRILGGSGVC